ncbi:MAG: hypothetical protein JW940_04510 [Polyangiaceae bacterium]|nr:hypothetical protein [Polyangiaceae bacterium]
MVQTLTGEYLTAKGGRAWKTTEVRTEILDPFNSKPVYRKAIDLGLLPNTTSGTVAHGITSLNCAEGAYMRIEGVVSDGTDVTPITLTASLTVCKVDATNVTITTTADLSSSRGLLLLEYTKT